MLKRPWGKQSLLKVRQSQSKLWCLQFSQKMNKKNHFLSILSWENTQDFFSFVGRTLDTIICFRDLLTFRHKGSAKSKYELTSILHILVPFSLTHFGKILQTFVSLSSILSRSTFFILFNLNLLSVVHVRKSLLFVFLAIFL